MPIEYRTWITRADVQKEPDKLFVFGDNLMRRGFGGQAREMRDEPNSIGIATKKRPSMKKDAFFTDSDFLEWITSQAHNMQRLIDHVEDGGIVVWPTDGIGTGYAKLRKSSPMIWYMLNTFEVRLDMK